MSEEVKNKEQTQEQIPQPVPTEPKTKEKKEKRVKIRLPRARDGEEDHELVGVNGVLYQIKKGVTVEVPASVAEVLAHRDEMLDAGDAYMDKIGAET